VGIVPRLALSDGGAVAVGYELQSECRWSRSASTRGRAATILGGIEGQVRRRAYTGRRRDSARMWKKINVQSKKGTRATHCTAWTDGDTRDLENGKAPGGQSTRTTRQAPHWFETSCSDRGERLQGWGDRPGHPGQAGGAGYLLLCSCACTNHCQLGLGWAGNHGGWAVSCTLGNTFFFRLVLGFVTVMD
jgi:hypothetical protein